jgi:hypothetical protein
VSEAGGRAYVEVYRKIDTNEGKNDVYRMTKVRERKTRDFNQVKCIKDESNRFLVKDEKIKTDGENTSTSCSMKSEKTVIELDDSFDDINKQFVRRIQKSEMKKALKRMKTGKTLGPDDILIEV